MSARRGFVLLEAVIALLIVSVFSIAALAAFGGRIRGSGVIEHTLTARALAEDRFAAIELLSGIPLPLPDSLSDGTFTAFGGYRWTATSRPVRDEENLYDIEVRIASDDGEYLLLGRLFRPPPLGRVQ